MKEKHLTSLAIFLATYRLCAGFNISRMSAICHTPIDFEKQINLSLQHIDGRNHLVELSTNKTTDNLLHPGSGADRFRMVRIVIFRASK